MTTSDTYKKIIALQKANNNVRGAVNAWLQDNLHEDAESLQALVMDTDGDFLPVPKGGWHEDNDEFNDQLDASKEKVYKDILSFIKGNPIDREAYVEVSDPTQPIVEEKPKPTKVTKSGKVTKREPEQLEIASAISTLLKHNNAGITEERVREIVREVVREEMSNAVESMYISIAE